MRVIRKTALIIETIIGFGVPVFTWFLGISMSPFLILWVVEVGGIEMVAAVLAIVLGGIGLWGMLQLAVKVIEPHSRVATPRKLLSCVVCGLLAVSIATVIFDFGPEGSSLIFLPPVLVSAHFLFLARGYFWKSS